MGIAVFFIFTQKDFPNSPSLPLFLSSSRPLRDTPHTPIPPLFLAYPKKEKSARVKNTPKPISQSSYCVSLYLCYRSTTVTGTHIESVQCQHSSWSSLLDRHIEAHASITSKQSELQRITTIECLRQDIQTSAILCWSV